MVRWAMVQGLRRAVERSSGGTVERVLSSLPRGGPLVSLECGQCWVQACCVGQLDSLDAPTGRLFAIGLQSFICWTCISCDIAEMPK